MTSVAITGAEGVEKMLDEYAPRARQNLERRAVRAGGKVIQAELKSLAAGVHPHSFTKVPAPKVSTHGEAGMEVFTVVRPKSPLFNILEPGAKGHTISPGEVGGNSSRPSRPTATKARSSGRRALAGRPGGSVWPEPHSDAGRKRGTTFFSARPVQHPGTKGLGMLPRAVAAAGGAAQDAMAAVIFGQDKGTALGTGS
jgi:hypothetical protein